MLRIKLVKSTIGHNPRNRATVKALGLTRPHSVVEHADTPTIRGMIRHVHPLLSVEVLPDAADPVKPAKVRKGAAKPAEAAPVAKAAAKPKAAKPKAEAAAEATEEKPKAKRTKKAAEEASEETK